MSRTAVCVCSSDSSSILYRKKENLIFVRTTGRKCDTKKMNDRTFTMTEIHCSLFKQRLTKVGSLLRLYWRACCSCTLAPFSPPRKITDVTSWAFQMYANRIVSPVLGGECSSGGQEAVQVCTVKPEVVWLFIHKTKFTEQSVRSRAPHSHMKTLQQHPPYFKHYLSLPWR